MIQRTYRTDVARMIARAMDLGGHGLTRKGSILWDWKLSGDCTDAYCTRYWGRRERGHPTRDDPPGSLYLDVWTRCRKCDNCKRSKARMWKHRAAAETRNSARTWFGTLTLSMPWHHTMYARARARVLSQGVEFDLLSAGEQFGLVHNQISPEITKLLKRVRATFGFYPAPVRHLVVTESHEGGGEADGTHHYHVLLHELTPDYPVRHKQLASQWKLGFSKWKLVDTPDEAASYVGKYVGKALRSRVMASEAYGECLPWEMEASIDRRQL